jgi:hypothetical protein
LPSAEGYMMKEREFAIWEPAPTATQEKDGEEK